MKSIGRNPWFILATAYGSGIQYHDKNRKLWNAWFCRDFSKGERKTFENEHSIFIDPWTDTYNQTLLKALSRPEVDFKLPLDATEIDFSDYYFDGVNFENYIFFKCVKFDNSRFPNPANFRGTLFLDTVTFSNVTFDQTVDFIRANFEGYALFDNVAFLKGAQFRHAKFIDGVNFITTTFNGIASFHNTKFEKTVDFTDAIFEKATNFRKSEFKSEYPILKGTNLHSQTSFTAEDSNWPKIKQPQKLLEKSVHSCAILRHNMSAQGLPDEAHFFFRREMSVKAQMASKQLKILYYLYDFISEYGISVKRPFYAIASLWLFVTLCLYAFSKISFSYALAISFSNIFKIFGFQNTYFEDNLFFNFCYPLKLLLASQTIIGFILIFLLGLGIRNLFKLK